MTSHSTRNSLYGALVLAALAPATILAQTERRTLSGSNAAVYNVAGRMSVEAGSGSDVIVEVTFRGRDASRLRIETGELRGANTLRVIYPDDDIIYSDDSFRRSSANFDISNDFSWGDNDRRDGDRRRVRVRSSGNGVEAWADIRILVPAGRVIDANLGVGELTSTGVNADQRLDVAAARVIATGSRGRLSIDAGSGGINVRDANVSDLELDTGSGAVTLTDVTSRRCLIDTGSGAVTGTTMTCDDIEIDVGSGGVRLDAVRAPNVRVESGSGSLDVNLTSTIRTLRVETGSGGVTLGMPENTSANVDISTGSGSISTDFPVQLNRVERRSMRGRIGSGDGTITVETGSGSVRLRKM